jgi:NAD(P)-dependent dehydrogenase (short-subunit alcohol dehydrogenase family)
MAAVDLKDPLAAFRLDGEVAVVTGGGNGLGRAIGTALAGAGAIVVLADHDTAAARTAAEEIALGGGRAEARAMDVTDEGAIAHVFEAVVAAHGRLDILINNAGIALRRPAVELELDDWHRVMDVNLTGVFLCARHAARHMIAGGGGRIVNMASIMSFSGGGLYPNVSYQSSKGAVLNLTRALAVEWAPNNIRVNAVAPTWTRTRLISGFLEQPEVVAALEGMMPLGRLADPEDIVGAVLFLVSRAAAMVTGHTLPVDGGFLAQ